MKNIIFAALLSLSLGFASSAFAENTGGPKCCKKKSKTECCVKKEACCEKKEACCTDNKSKKKTSKAECCVKKEACCTKDASDSK